MFRKYATPFHADDPRVTLAHREIILRKRFLTRLYTDWYATFGRHFKNGVRGRQIEIGSGGGFLKALFPDVITSDIVALPDVDCVFSAEALPFASNALACVALLNVFHHIPRPYLFLKEAERTLVAGGTIIMIEPANSVLSRFIYKRFHYEPFAEDGPRVLEAGNRLSTSNQALPYIYFERDVELFRRECPSLKLVSISYHSPFAYVVSGGVSRSAILPSFMYPVVKGLEWLSTPLSRQIGLFCTIEIQKL